MILAIVFAVACLAFGFAATLALKLDVEARAALGVAAGVLAGGWFCLFLSWFALGGLSAASVALSSLILAAAALLLYKKFGLPKKAVFDKKTLALLGTAALLFLLLNLRVTLEPDAAGGAVSVINVWGDGPFHYGLVNSFAFGSNLPPEYPVLAGTPLGYPFLMDFWSACLVAGGLDLRSSVVYANALVFLALLCGAYALFKRLGGKRAALIGLLLFFANGNAGIINAAEGGFALDKDYSHLEDAGLWFMNATYSLFVPQRSILLGYAIACCVFILFYDYVFGKAGKRELFFAGVLAGLSPLAHAHSALAIGLVFAAMFAYKPKKEWLWFLAPAAVLGLPQVWWMLGQVRHGFAGVHIGWLNANEGKNLLELAAFWLANGWLILVLGVLGWFYAKKPEAKKFALPFAAFFILGNTIRFQAWDWDNIKILSYWFFASAALAGIFLDRLLSSKKNWLKAAAWLLTLLAIASALLTFAWMVAGSNARYEVYSSQDFRLAEWAKANTPATAVFLTADSPQDPVSSLAGRRIALGFKGWLWSHGLDYSKRSALAEAAYGNPSCATLRQLGVDYVLLSPRERSLNPDYAAFDSAPFLAKVFDANEYRVYAVSC